MIAHKEHLVKRMIHHIYKSPSKNINQECRKKYTNGNHYDNHNRM